MSSLRRGGKGTGGEKGKHVQLCSNNSPVLHGAVQWAGITTTCHAQHKAML